MIIENSGLTGMKSDLAYMDEVMGSLGFVRWQWEYYRATYDLKLVEQASKEEYYLRINTRAESGKLESPDALLNIEDVYMGVTSFPHGLDYDSPIPQNVMSKAQQTLSELKKRSFPNKAAA